MFLTIVLLSSALAGSPQNPGTTPAPAPQYTLIWSDEFNGANGSSPDPEKWVRETGGDGWGNDELQSYTARPENARIQDGNLVITAIQESFAGSDGITRQYTSARLKTSGLFDQKYGKFEARVKIPQGQGIWPAFWLLGSNCNQIGGWPDCGEIDIMENIGKEPSTVYGSLHGGGYDFTAGYSLADGKFADDFHTYAVEWEPSAIRFYVDGNLYQTRMSMDIPAGKTWAFDHPFFIILNVAVGGFWPGSPDQTSIFPQTMLVDYVRVYKKQ